MPNNEGAMEIGGKIYFTVKKVAPLLGVGEARLRQLIRDGRIPAFKMGRDWVLNPVDARMAKKKMADDFLRANRPGRHPNPLLEETPTNDIDDLL